MSPLRSPRHRANQVGAPGKLERVHRPPPLITPSLMAVTPLDSAVTPSEASQRAQPGRADTARRGGRSRVESPTRSHGPGKRSPEWRSRPAVGKRRSGLSAHAARRGGQIEGSEDDPGTRARAAEMQGAAPGGGAARPRSRDVPARGPAREGLGEHEDLPLKG
jgi:hypothetical protein